MGRDILRTRCWPRNLCVDTPLFQSGYKRNVEQKRKYSVDTMMWKWEDVEIDWYSIYDNDFIFYFLLFFTVPCFADVLGILYINHIS